MNNAILTIENLTISLPKGADRPHAIQEISFELIPGEMLCVVGESGSGKSMTANAIMGLLPKNLHVVQGHIPFGDRDIIGLSESDARKLRGSDISMIFQEPMTALNPLMKIKQQIDEVFEFHTDMTLKMRRERILALLTDVGLPEPKKIMNTYPHQLSGGQRQRVMIAMALALEPSILIADEPTTALDVTTQAQILNLIKNLQQKHGTSVMFITHDFGVVAEIADRVIVMEKGNIVEMGEAGQVLNNPTHPYTCKLINAVPPLTPAARESIDTESRNPILEVKNLNKTYVSGRGLFSKGREVVAAKDVNFDIYRGETLGLVGESGSGKSTVSRCVVRLLDADSGTISIDGNEIQNLKSKGLMPYRNRIQMIFQDPYASLNPRKTIGRIIADGPIASGVSVKEAIEKSRELLKLVELPESALKRYPHEFSGGQRQRIGIARALAHDPEILVADEAISALDVSIQAQILDLIDSLKNKLNLAVLFVVHDLRVAAQVCDRVIVMQKGIIVESGKTDNLFNNPQHQYTQNLLNSIPGAHWRSEVSEIGNEIKSTSSV